MSALHAIAAIERAAQRDAAADTPTPAQAQRLAALLAAARTADAGAA